MYACSYIYYKIPYNICHRLYYIPYMCYNMCYILHTFYITCRYTTYYVLSLIKGYILCYIPYML